MAGLEKDFYQRRVKPDLDALGDILYWRIENLVGNGVPDVVGIYRGRFFALELKRSQKDAKKDREGQRLQMYYLKKIGKFGGFARMAYPENWDTVYRLIKSL